MNNTVDLPRIPYSKPSITDLEVRYTADAVKSGWGSRCYDYIYTFERLFREYLDVPYSVATSSCTGALHIGLSALGIGLGDEVILADSNWIATVAPVIQLGAKPIFVDIQKDSWCLDPDAVEAAITSKTKAIIAVHLYGNLCDMRRLLDIGDKYGLPIIEDAAEALGSCYGEKRAGSMGAFGVFSFHGTKTITTGEGGMFVTKDRTLFEKFIVLSNHGRNPKEDRQFWPESIGFKYKMSNIQAALGCAQMERISELTSRKKEILNFYRERLEVYPGVSMNRESKNEVNGAWMPTVVFSQDIGVTRERTQAAFKRENIDSRVFFWPLSSLPMFEANRSNVNSWSIPPRAINLPSFHDITQDELARVVSAVLSVMKF